MKCRFAHIVLRLSALFAALSLSASCGDPHDIKLESYDITSLALNGLRGVDASLALEINNPSVKLKVTDIEGRLCRDTTTIAYFSAEDFVLKRKCTEVYPINCTMNLDKGVTLLDVLNLVKNYKTSDILVDLSANVSHGPVKRSVVRNGIPVKKLIER